MSDVPAVPPDPLETKAVLRPRRRPRWGRILVALFLVVLVVGAASLPAVLSHPSARPILLGQAARVLAPARLEVQEFRFSWIGPTRMKGFRLIDGHEDPVAAAPEAVWDRNLFQILFDRPRYGTLTLERGRLEIERDAEGHVDLYESLRPILGRDPRTDLTIQIRRGSLRLSAPELASPLEVPGLELTLQRPPFPKLVSWRIELAGTADAPEARCRIHGDFDHARHVQNRAGDLTLLVDASAWPLNLRVEGRDVAVQLDGKARLERRKGVWSSRGEGTAARLAIAGLDPGFSLDGTRARWDVSRAGAAWTVRDLAVTTALGELHTDGTASATLEDEKASQAGATLEGRLDLAALGALVLPQEAGVERGRARVRLETSYGPAADAQKATGPDTVLVSSPERTPMALQVQARVEVDEVAARRGERRIELPPTTWSLKARLRPESQSAEVAELVVTAPQGELKLSGKVETLIGARSVSVDGELAPDWVELNNLLAEAVEPGAVLEGASARFQVRGTLPTPFEPADLWTELDSEVRVPVSQVELFGLRLGPFEIGARYLNGRLRFEPVSTTLNGGRLVLRPEIVRDPAGSYSVVLDAGSRIEDAEINEEVSGRILAYAVPILERATRVRGRVSVNIEEASFPITPAVDRRAEARGMILFQDVAFTPGPLGTNLLDLMGVTGQPEIRLDKPVILSVHDGVVEQHSTIIPIAGALHMEMKGTVGFDSTLNLDVSLPLDAGRFAEVPVFNRIAGAIRPTVPVRGTLRDPRVDTKALGSELGKMGVNIAEQAGVGGIEALFEILSRPRDPAEEARRQAEAEQRKAEAERRRQERRARMEQRRAERRRGQGQG